ncbi:MAG: hypothetical protein QM811_28825 [Pirellulales bacterium]
MTTRTKSRAALTLLELLLALALAAVVLMAVNGAMNTFYYGLEKTRNQAERDQVGRTSLRRVSEDLRSAVQYIKFDTSGMQGAGGGAAANAASLLSAATGGSSTSGSGSSSKSGTGSSTSGGSSASGSSSGSSSSKSGSGGGSSSTGSSASSSSSTDSSSTDTSTATAQTMPGVYGGTDWLQIDVCRLPRPDEMASGNIGLYADVRSVSYSVNTGGSTDVGMGLIRSEVHRAAALYSSQNGNSLEAPAQVLRAGSDRRALPVFRWSRLAG